MNQRRAERGPECRQACARPGSCCSWTQRPYESRSKCRKLGWQKSSNECRETRGPTRRCHCACTGSSACSSTCPGASPGSCSRPCSGMRSRGSRNNHNSGRGQKSRTVRDNYPWCREVIRVPRSFRRNRCPAAIGDTVGQCPRNGRSVDKFSQNVFGHAHNSGRFSIPFNDHSLTRSQDLLLRQLVRYILDHDCAEVDGDLCFVRIQIFNKEISGLVGWDYRNQSGRREYCK